MIVRAKTKIRLLILLASVVLLIGGAATVYGIRKSRVRQLFITRRAEGMAFYKNGDYANTVIKLGQVIRREEYAQDAEAIYAFAEARKQVETADGRHLRDAMTMLQRVLSIPAKQGIGPRPQDVERELLELYTQLGYNNEAIELADKVLKDDPNDQPAMRANARALAANQQSQEALKLCEDFNKLVPLDLEMRVLSMEVLRDLHQREKILDQVQDLLAKYPGDGKAELITSFGFTWIEGLSDDQRKSLGNLITERYPDSLPKLGDNPKRGEKPQEWDNFAFSNFFARRASERDLSDPTFVRYLIEQLDRTRQIARSVWVLEKLDAQQEIPWVRRLLIRRLWDAGRFTDVLPRIEKLTLTGSTPGEVEMLAMRGIAEARTNLAERAAATATILANLKDDRFAQAWSTVINEQFLKPNGDAKQVIKSINFALELQRNHPYLRFFLGMADLQIGERDAGFDAISQAVTLRPLWQLARLQLSLLNFEAGQKQSAFEDASEAYIINPTVSAASNLAITAAAKTDLSTITTDSDLFLLVTGIQTKVPGEEATLPLYVQLLAATKQDAQAKALINKLLSSPKLPAPSTLLRLASASRACNLELEEPCLAAAEKSGMTPQVATARATALVEAGNVDGAVTYFQDRMQKAGVADVSWRLAFAAFLEQIKDKHAAATWIALGDDPAFKDILLVQQAALAAGSTQKDAAFISRTIDRIRAITGDQSTGWKLAQARLTLRDQTNSVSPQLIKTLSDIVAAAPSNIQARALLASAYEKTGNIPAAFEQLLAACKLQPKSAILNLQLARLYTIQLDFQRAREIFSSMRPGSLEPAQARIAARLIGQQGDINLAIEFMESAQADAPPLDRLYLAELYRRVNLNDKAEPIYDSLLQNPQNLEIVMSAADYFASRGKKEQAMRVLANLENLSLKPAEKDFAMAEYSAHHGDANEALSRFEAVVQEAPTRDNAWRALITKCFKMGKSDQAVDAAARAVRALPPNSAKPFQNIVDSQSSLRALATEKSLVPLMVALMDASPNGEAAAKALPVIVEAIKTKAGPQEVLTRLRPIADQAPALGALQMLLVENYLNLNKPEEAAAIALRSQRLSPTSPEIARNAAVAVAATGKLAQALAPAQQWRQLTSENPLPADVFIARLQLDLQDYVSAMHQVQPYLEKAKANPRDENSASIIALHARALIMRGDDSGAMELLAPYLAEQPQMRAICRELSGFLPNLLAEKWIARVSAATPADDVNENLDLAFAWHQLYAGRPRFKAGTNDPKHKAAAVAILDRLATIAQDNPTVVQARAILAELDGRTAAAEQGYRRTLELAPNAPLALNNLAMMVCNRGELNEAISLAQKAVTASPRDAQIRDTLAYVQLKMKDYSNAQENLKLAASLDPQNIKWRIKLAQAYDVAGQTQDLSKLLDEIEAMTIGINISPADRETIRQLRSKLPAKTASR